MEIFSNVTLKFIFNLFAKTQKAQSAFSDSFAGAKPKNEDHNQRLPAQPGRVRSTARNAVHALHTHRKPTEGLRVREIHVQAYPIPAR